MYLISICMSSLRKCLFRSSAHYFDWVVCFLLLNYTSYLYILEINPLSAVSFASIFSHSIDCLFILFMVSFAVQTHVSVIRSYLFIFAFVSFTLGVVSKIIRCNLCQRVFCLYFPLEVSQYLVLRYLRPKYVFIFVRW